LVDDSSFVYQALKLVFEAEGSIRIAAYAQTARNALHLFGHVQADVAILDALMPEIDGFELARRVRVIAPKLPILFFSGVNAPNYVERARAIGAAGWIVKDYAADLIANIKQAAAGGPFIAPDPRHGIVMFPSIDAPVIPTEGKEALTAREIEIVRLTVADLEVKQIADRLGISVRTVEAHRAHIFQKLGTRSIARLTKYAIANGLTTL
jgi:DNA-binding NarL/FixJ family response regulator